MPPSAESRSGSRRRYRRAALGGISLGSGLVAAAFALVTFWDHDAGETIYQGLAAETRNALVGGRYRVSLRCSMPDNRVSYFTRARSSQVAHETLRWTLPVCEMVAMSAQVPPGRDQSSFIVDWYRGDFICPTNHHRRSVRLSALSIDAAVTQAAAGTRDCRIEYVDQTHCPLTRPGCQRTGEDFREAAHVIALRGKR